MLLLTLTNKLLQRSKSLALLRAIECRQEAESYILLEVGANI
jgi:hypothetical protein